MLAGSVLSVDLNADIGEGFPDDLALLGVVTSASVACGFHAGDESTMLALCHGAAARGVAIGAHVSYRDREGFGRRPLEVAAETIHRDTVTQLSTLAGCAERAGTRVAYVKPHGALYHRASVDRACADAIVGAAAPLGAAMLGPPESTLLEAARAIGLDAVAEAFADRAYAPDGDLVPRADPRALLDPDAAVTQALHLVLDHRATAVDGTPIDVDARSLCVHGDTPGAALLASRLLAALRAAGVELRPFT